MLAPLVYLVLRAFQADLATVTGLLLRRRTLDLLVNITALALGVVRVRRGGAARASGAARPRRAAGAGGRCSGRGGGGARGGPPWPPFRGSRPRLRRG